MAHDIAPGFGDKDEFRIGLDFGSKELSTQLMLALEVGLEYASDFRVRSPDVKWGSFFRNTTSCRSYLFDLVDRSHYTSSFQFSNPSDRNNIIDILVLIDLSNNRHIKIPALPVHAVP